MTDEQTIDGTAEEILAADPPPVEPPPVPSTAVARRERRSEVIRPLNADALAESFHEYQELLPKLLTDSDYQDAGRGKRFVKKSGWRKIATAFDLDVQLIRSTIERDESGQPQRAEVWARAIAPSGRSMDGDGYCSIDEERFSGPRGNKSKLENDLRATATTRAMNRAISGLVGMGDVSAEEVDGGRGDTGPAFGPAYEGNPRDVGNAAAALVGAKNFSKVIQPVLDRAGYMPQIVADAILAAAAASGNVVAPGGVVMLPVVQQDNGLLVADPDTGELVPIREAPDRVLAAVADEIAQLDRQVYEARRALAAELRDRHGVGTCHAGGYRFTVAESQSWPVKATSDALDQLARDGRIGEADVLRCMPERPKPDARQLKALIGRLTVSDPEAAKVLADACTVSPPSVRDVQVEAVDAEDESC